MKKLFRVAFVAMLIAVLCLGMANAVAESNTTVMLLNESAIDLAVQKTFRLTYIVEGNEALGIASKVQWLTSDSAIATVSGGTVTGKAPGNAVITLNATFSDGTVMQAQAEVNVYIPAVSLAALPAKLTLNAGETSEAITIQVTPKKATYTHVTWSSDNEAVAIVSADGKVTAKQAGVTTLTAMLNEPLAANKKAKTATVRVTVLQPVTAIVRDETSVEVAEVGKAKKRTLNTVILPENASNKALKWTTSDAKVLTVVNGKVTGVSLGTATVTAEAKDGSGAAISWDITVYQPVTKITADTAKITLQTGDCHPPVGISVSPEKAEYTGVIWASSDERVAVVGEDGTITALKAGKTTITATSIEPIDELDKPKAASIVVNVLQPVTSLEQTSPNVEVGKGKTTTLLITPMPADATQTKLKYTSADPKVASVVNGKVTGVSIGTTEITAVTTDGSDISTVWSVTVYAPVTNITANTQALTLNVNETSAPLQYTVKPDHAMYTGVTWSSSDESVATIDELGAVTAIKAGSAKLIATSIEPIDAKAVPKTAVVQLKVLQPATGLTFADQNVRVAKGKTLKLNAIVAPEDTSNKKLTWTTSDPKIVTVQNGTITGKGVGTATVTATTADGTQIAANCTVTVFQAVTSITSKISKFGVTEGRTYQLLVTAMPADASDKSILWRSDNTNIATVDQYGRVTAVSEGTCKIIAEAKDGSGKKYSFTMYTEPKVPLDAITFTRSGYFGYYTEFAITFKNLNKSRTITYIGFNVKYNSKTYSFYTDRDRLSPKSTKKIGWWDSPNLTFANGFTIYLTSVEFSDGTWEFYSDQPVLGYFN